ncbi:hypothetical protein OTU49_006914 [Cherax quadricarinatus]|uniref:Uncharacterized protein n=1 Tax=Cherax quadricarinatus TaxID=27406 RepID=A0AAW0WZA5_CHEQU
MATTDSAHTWTPPSAKVLRAGEPSDGRTHAHTLPQEDYYNSVKFTVGYQELQARWSRGTPGHTPRTSHKTSTFMPHQELLTTQARYASDAPRPNKRWDSSVDTSSLDIPHTVPSSVDTSPAISPRPERMRDEKTVRDISYTLSCACASQESYCECEQVSREEVQDAVGDHSSKGRWAGVVDALRRVLTSLRSRPPPAPPNTSLHRKVAELECELETYKQLSEAKKRSADLLKYQLMEVLYEQVVKQVEDHHLRRLLEREVMGLEIENHLLRLTTNHDLIVLCTQLLSDLAEKLQHHLHTEHLTHDEATYLGPDITTYNSGIMSPKLRLFPTTILTSWASCR